MSKEFFDTPLARRWVLVAGTGLKHGTPEADILAARAVGRELASYRYGLVTGGWHGVDFATADEFVNTLRSLALNPDDYLIQVVAEHRAPVRYGGRVVVVPSGAREWLEPQKYADAVVLIGGRGGTYRTWLGALHDGIPRFPLGGTTGDAEAAFKQTLDLWELIPIRGIARTDFEALAQSIRSQADATAVAHALVSNLLPRALNAFDALSRPQSSNSTTMFISYSRRDANWIQRLRTLLRPAERRGVLQTWVDADLEPGKSWKEQIQGRINRSQAALLCVSPALLKSTFVRKTEFPALTARRSDPSFRLFWTLIEPCAWQSVPNLSQIQAIGSTDFAVSESATGADEQCRLIEIVNTLTRILAELQPSY
jgi:hypothetical protein